MQKSCFSLAGVLMLTSVLILPAAADEQLDRNSYRAVPGEVYHVLAGVRWYEDEGGSLLFNRLDGERGSRSWFVDFLGEEETDGYVWPENCNIALRRYKPGSGENVMEEGWLRDHDAILRFREGYPVSGYDIKVLDTLASGSGEDAVRLVMNLKLLFNAPMMRGEGISWSLENSHDPENHILSFSVQLVTPYGIASEWDFKYGRDPATGEIVELAIRVSSTSLFGYEKAPAEAVNIVNRADALTQNFNNLFLYRLYNYLNIYHTEKWPGYTLKYPDAVLRFEAAEWGGGYGYSFLLVPEELE